MRNTKKEGVARILFLSTKKGYEAVCLDFDLIEEGDSMEEVQKGIMEAVRGHLKAVINNDLNDDLLNRHADKKYWTIYKRLSAKMAVDNLANIREGICALPFNELARV